MNYEERIAALFATKMLAASDANLWEEVPIADLLTITMQTPDAVDDIVLTRKGADGKIYVSAKSRGQRVPLTMKSPAFTDTVDAFVLQFLRLTPVERQTCWLVWAVPPTAREQITRDLRRTLDAQRLCDVDCPLKDFIDGRTKREREAFEPLLAVANASWQKAAGASPSELDMRTFLRRVRVEVFEFGPSGDDTRRAEEILADSVVLDLKQAAHAWNALENFFGQRGEYGTPVTRLLLRKALTKARVALKPPAGYAEEIARLRELTLRNLTSLAVHDTIQPTADPSEAIHLDRAPELHALRAAAEAGHLLLTGEPGSGKSGLMHSLAKTWQESTAPVVLLLADQLSGRDWKGAANLPGFDRHPLDAILTNWPSDTPGILLTDALDAVRDLEAQRMLRGLLADVKNGRSGWKVIASVREFDLDHGRELREMFPGAGVPGFASTRFNGVAHFHVPRLSDAQLDDLIRQREQFRPFIEHAWTSPKSEDLHRSPFYLRLAAELMRAGVSPERVADWTSPALLLGKYWEERVTKEPHSAESKHVLRAICARMVDARSTVIAEQDLPLQLTDYTGIRELRSRGVLQAPVRAGGVRVGDGALGFTHHLLHDYAIAAALIPRQPPQRLVSFIVDNRLLPIFYRQSFVFALEELWDAAGDGDRQLFWDAALRLENTTTLHGITRIVAPILAARRVQVLGDLQPLLDALAAQPGGNTPAHRALGHLVSGVHDVHPATVRASADGWLRFAVALSTLLPRDATLEWPLVHLLDRLNALDETQPLPSRALLNDAGRRLLAECLASARRHYSMNVAIVAVCQSFNTAPVESRAALLALLDPARLAHFPHHELSQLARCLKHLGPNGDEIVCRLFEAIFTREPMPGDWEERGSVLSSMRLQTSDQWNSIRHTLANYYGTLGDDNADLVSKLACLVSNSASHRHTDKVGVKTIVLATVPFRGVTCELVEDFAHVRGHGSDDNRGVIVSRFGEHLRAWAAADDQPRLAAALDRFARDTHNSSLWSVVMEVGVEHPAPLGTLLEPVLDAPLFQMHPDYRYAGVELLAALHRTGDPSRRERLERLVLSLPQRHHAWRQTNDALERLIVEAQRRLLGRLRDADPVLEESRALKAAGPLPGNERPGGIEFFSHTYTDAEVMAEHGIELSEPANAEMFRLRDELKHFLHQNNQSADPTQIELRWPVIEQTEHALAHADTAHPQMARELWGYLVGACANTAAVMNWPADNARWLAVCRVLLKAATDPDPVVETGDGNDDGDEDNEELKSLSWVWPAPRINAAEGLPDLARRLGTVDEPVADALRCLSCDGSNPLRNNLARRLFLLHAAAPALMWELLETFAAREPRFIVLTGAVEALGRLWSLDEAHVESILDAIAARAVASAPAQHPIHLLLASTHLFHYLRTGGAASERHVAGLIATCDAPCADDFWSSQLHGCREGGWLTGKQGGRSFPDADAARQRTWRFFLALLAAARPKLDAARAALRALDPHADPESEPVRRLLETRDRLGRLMDHVAMQIYFASGAFDNHQPRHNDSDEPLSPAERHRFWNDAAACLASLAEEAHPSVAHHIVQTLAHLLPCAPGEIFLLARRSIRTSAAGGGFQYEPQAVGEIVKLVRRVLADYPDLLTVDGGESPVFSALLEVLDVFVEAGWPEARRLTHSLEDIYR